MADPLESASASLSTNVKSMGLGASVMRTDAWRLVPRFEKLCREGWRRRRRLASVRLALPRLASLVRCWRLGSLALPLPGMETP